MSLKGLRIEFAVLPGRTVETAAEEFGKIVAVSETNLQSDFADGHALFLQQQIGCPGQPHGQLIFQGRHAGGVFEMAEKGAFRQVEFFAEPLD